MGDYLPAAGRYERMEYRRCGASGLRLPALSLGLWHNFGETKNTATKRAVLRRAFDLGITYFDLANNYGPPYGSAEESFGEIFAADFAAHRDEVIVATKAGYDMWPGPYGDGGSRKYLLSSLDQSLRRMRLDYVDIFYHHRPDPETPMAESLGAVASAIQQGKALYAGISNYSPAQTLEAIAILDALGVPLLVHQPSYSIFNRHVERASDEAPSLLDVIGTAGVGAAVFSPLQQGLATGRYLAGIPADSRAAVGHFLRPEAVTEDYLVKARALNAIAEDAGMSLAELALRWVLRDQRVTTAIIGASSVAQLDDNVAALSRPPLSDEQIEAIEPYATELR